MYSVNISTFQMILVIYFVLHILKKKINKNFGDRKYKLSKFKYIFLSISSFLIWAKKLLIKIKNLPDYLSSSFCLLDDQPSCHIFYLFIYYSIFVSLFLIQLCIIINISLLIYSSFAKLHYYKASAFYL